MDTIYTFFAMVDLRTVYLHNFLLFSFFSQHKTPEFSINLEMMELLVSIKILNLILKPQRDISLAISTTSAILIIISILF